jgi:hypothetical protein
MNLFKVAVQISIFRRRNFIVSSFFWLTIVTIVPWIPEPSALNNKLKRHEGSGSTEGFFD